MREATPHDHVAASSRRGSKRCYDMGCWEHGQPHILILWYGIRLDGLQKSKHRLYCPSAFVRYMRERRLQADSCYNLQANSHRILNVLESNLPPVFLTVSATVSHLGRSRLSRLSSCFAHGKVDGEPTEYTNEHQNEHARLHRLDRKAVGKSSRTCERQSAASQDHLGSNVTHRMGR